MATGSMRWRGFSVQASVPDRLLDLARRKDSRLGNLVFKDPPPKPSFRRREPRHALAFLGADVANGTAAARQPLSDDASLEQQVGSIPWYHTIELPGGITTPGRFDHRQLVPRYGFPATLEGKTALDVATFDGFWSFEMERRGAKVTAIDLATTRDLDFPTLARPVVDQTANLPPLGEGFGIAKAALGSSVERIPCSVYDLNPATHGTFDLVHCGDLLLHLRDPLRALEKIRSVTAGSLLLSDCVGFGDGTDTEGFNVVYRGGWTDVVWWLPSLSALAQMTIDAGFSDTSVNAVYNLAKTSETQGFWRVSLTCRV